MATFSQFMKGRWLETFLVENGLYADIESYSSLFPMQVANNLSEVKQLIAENFFPTFQGLAPAALWCLFFCLARFVFERTIFKNLATFSMNINFISESSKPELAKIPKEVKRALGLIKVPFMKKNQDDDEEKKKANKDKYDMAKAEYLHKVADYCKEKDIRFEAANSYLRLKKENDATAKKTKKFIEAFWRGLFYSIFIAIGFQVLFYCKTEDHQFRENDNWCDGDGRVKWIDNLSLNWMNYPYHSLSDPVKFYYHIQLGCYVHQLIWSELTITRTDAVEMILHHVATITLLSVSYITNFTRIGSLILLTHDVADVFLEFAKCLNYIAQNNKKIKNIVQPVCDGLFGCFVIIFFLSRLVYYPFYILNSYFFTEGYSGWDFTGGKIFTVCLLLLQILHVYWFYLIILMIKRLLSPKGIETDCRSDDDELSNKSDDRVKRKSD